MLYYVTEGSALDKEALNRLHSAYVTDSSAMLPSDNGSVLWSVDRLAQSAIMIDPS